MTSEQNLLTFQQAIVKMNRSLLRTSLVQGAAHINQAPVARLSRRDGSIFKINLMASEPNTATGMELSAGS